MQKQKGFAPILIILLIALAVGGYFIYQNQQKPAPAPQQIIQPTIKPTAVPFPGLQAPTTPVINAPVPTDWKTYTNVEYGFQVSYPAGEIVTDEVNTRYKNLLPNLLQKIGINIKGLKGQMPVWGLNNDNPYNLQIIIWNNLGIRVKDISTKNEWCTLIESKLQSKDRMDIGLTGCNSGGDYVNSIIDGMSSLRVRGGWDGGISDQFLIPNKNYVYQIDIITGTLGDTGEVHFPLSDQILSTFKFTQ